MNTTAKQTLGSVTTPSPKGEGWVGGRLSEHFKLEEFTRSPTAKAHGISNDPTPLQMSNMKALCEKVLEPLRNAFKCPIVIGSGYRCQKLNKLVGGVYNSQHMTGEAADIHIPDNELGLKWFEWIRTHCPYDQLIIERNTKNSTRYWIHVSYRRDGKNRMQVIRNLIKNK